LALLLPSWHRWRSGATAAALLLTSGSSFGWQDLAAGEFIVTLAMTEIAASHLAHAAARQPYLYGATFIALSPWAAATLSQRPSATEYAIGMAITAAYGAWNIARADQAPENIWHNNMIVFNLSLVATLAHHYWRDPPPRHSSWPQITLAPQQVTLNWRRGW
jgi:hypothetical protein